MLFMHLPLPQPLLTNSAFFWHPLSSNMLPNCSKKEPKYHQRYVDHTAYKSKVDEESSKVILIAVVIVSWKLKKSASDKSWEVNQEWKSKIKTIITIIKVLLKVNFWNVSKEKVKLNKAVKEYEKEEWN